MKQLLTATVFLFALLSTGCKRSDGDRLARVGNKVTQKVQALVPERTPFRGSIELNSHSELETRVRQRFQSDTYLAPQPIDLIFEGNVVRLRGQLDDPVLKHRAVEIAESTVGVANVIDEIVVAK